MNARLEAPQTPRGASRLQWLPSYEQSTPVSPLFASLTKSAYLPDTTPLTRPLFSYSYALFGKERQVMFFVCNALRTLSQKHRGCTPSGDSVVAGLQTGAFLPFKKYPNGTDLKIGHYKGKRLLEMAAEFAEAGEDDEFAGAGGDGLVLHVPGVLMRDVDGVEADTKGGIDVAARGIADHPAMGFDDFVFRDEAGVRDGIFFVDDFDGFEEALQAGALDFGGLLGGFTFGEKNEAMTFGEVGERFGNTVENFGWRALEVDNAIVNFGERFALGQMLGELHVRFFERTAETADAVAVLADIFAFGFVEDVANVGAGETARFDESDEVLDEVLEENIVFPEGVVGVDEESIASHS